jgi:hypothetical protein
MNSSGKRKANGDFFQSTMYALVISWGESGQYWSFTKKRYRHDPPEHPWQYGQEKPTGVARSFPYITYPDVELHSSWVWLDPAEAREVWALVKEHFRGVTIYRRDEVEDIL